MRFSSSFITLASLVVASLAAPSVKRTAAEVIADLKTITTQVNSLNTAINAFPATGGTLLQALNIHTAAGTLNTDVNAGTADVDGPFSEADGQTILAAVNVVAPIILDALSSIVEKKPAFDALPVGGISSLVKQDLTNLGASTNAFDTALVNAAPTDLKATATSLKNSIDAALASALAAYS